MKPFTEVTEQGILGTFFHNVLPLESPPGGNYEHCRFGQLFLTWTISESERRKIQGILID